MKNVMEKGRIGCEAHARQIILNREKKCIQIEEDTGNQSTIELPIKSQSETGWREHNIEMIKKAHQLTDGGRGRYVSAEILRGWTALGLVDNSVKTDLMGFACD